MSKRQNLARWIVVVGGYLLVVSVFPRAAWIRRLGWRGRIRLALAQTAWSTVARHWLRPAAQRHDARVEQRRADAAMSAAS